FAAIDATGARLTELGAANRLKALVVGPRLAPLVSATFERFDAKDRLGVATQVQEVLRVLEQSGLAGSIAPRDLLAASARALLRSDVCAAAPPQTGSHGARSRAVRATRPRVSNGFVLCDLGLCLIPGQHAETSSIPADVVALVASLPED